VPASARRARLDAKRRRGGTKRLRKARIAPDDA
jgi:hypothetical protein